MNASLKRTCERCSVPCVMLKFHTCQNFLGENLFGNIVIFDNWWGWRIGDLIWIILYMWKWSDLNDNFKYVVKAVVFFCGMFRPIGVNGLYKGCRNKVDLSLTALPPFLCFITNIIIFKRRCGYYISAKCLKVQLGPNIAQIAVITIAALAIACTSNLCNVHPQWHLAKWPRKWKVSNWLVFCLFGHSF